jgi:aurora kinase
MVTKSALAPKAAPQGPPSPSHIRGWCKDDKAKLAYQPPAATRSIIIPDGWTLHENLVVVPPEPKSDWNIDDFEPLQRLGGGQYGSVYLASVKGTNYLVALKKMELQNLVDNKLLPQLRREIEIAFNARHPYLLRTYGYFWDNEHIFLILEPCAKGMLYSELQRVKCYPPSTAARYVAQLAEALLYLHQHNILHRDIKPENILLDHNSNIKLSDFGWSVHDPNNRRETACGTPEYFPPEIVERRPYDTTVDLWCLGIFCYELLVGSTPFAAKHTEKTPKEQTDEITANILRMEYAFPPSVPEDARDMISGLLQRSGRRRLSLQQVLRHPFLTNNYYIPNELEPPIGKRERE